MCNGVHGVKKRLSGADSAGKPFYCFQGVVSQWQLNFSRTRKGHSADVSCTLRKGEFCKSGEDASLPPPAEAEGAVERQEAPNESIHLRISQAQTPSVSVLSGVEQASRDRPIMDPNDGIACIWTCLPV